MNANAEKIAIEQWDEILSQISGKLRRRLCEIPKESAQWMISLPNERIISPIADALMKMSTPHLRLRPIAGSIKVSNTEPYDQSAIERWSWYKTKPIWTGQYPSHPSGTVQSFDFKQSNYSTLDLLEAMLGLKTDPEKALHHLVAGEIGFALPQVEELFNRHTKGESLLLENGPNFFFVEFGHGYEFLAVVQDAFCSGGWTQEVYTCRPTCEYGFHSYHGSRLFVFAGPEG